MKPAPGSTNSRLPPSPALPWPPRRPPGLTPGQGKKIGLAVANLQAEFFNMIKQSVEAYGKEQGYAIVTVDARGDATTQVNQIQDLEASNEISTP